MRIGGVVIFSLYFYSMFYIPFVDNQCSILECRWENLCITLKDWQSFNGSVIAFIASLIVVYSTTLSEKNKELQKRKVARAFLPQALTDILNYIKDMAVELDNINQGILKPSEMKRPELPNLALKRIEVFLEYTQKGDQLLSEHLIIILNVIQIYNSRLDSYDDLLLKNDAQGFCIFNHIQSCTKLSALILGMYPFARNKIKNYNVKRLSQKLIISVSGISLYFTDSELEELSKKPISLESFTS